jgi:hypothetical protein
MSKLRKRAEAVHIIRLTPSKAFHNTNEPLSIDSMDSISKSIQPQSSDDYGAFILVLDTFSNNINQSLQSTVMIPPTLPQNGKNGIIQYIALVEY